MKNTMLVAGIQALIFMTSSACFASGYSGDMAEAWKSSSMVVLGVPQAIDAHGNVLEGQHFQHEGRYRLVVEKAYTDEEAGFVIEFIDVHHRSTASLHLRRDSRHVIFIQTPKDRTRPPPHPLHEEIGDELTGLRAIHADGDALDDIETGLAIVKRYGSLPQEERKAFLLEHLPGEYKYAHSLINREILRNHITEAVPYFQKKLSEANDEIQKLNFLNYLRILGEPNIKDVLISWLNDPEFKSKGETIEEMVRLKDRSLIPEIERFVHAKDERIAVRARSALLRLGEPGATELLFDMLNMSEDRTVRYNAIHVLHWGYKGDFSAGQKAMILELREDADESIARVAGFIADKWEQ